ncbi:hypothetical protein HPOKI112_03380 [Helicobacter pylori oki112]|nr:hypothetical protein HPOKI112_03380 [Helicobacter pylori oki112]
MAGVWGFAFFFFLLKCVRKIRHEGKNEKHLS